MSWLFVSSEVFTSSLESGGSFCLRFEFVCLSLILDSVEINGDSVTWEIGWVFTGVDGDMYCRIYSVFGWYLAASYYVMIAVKLLLVLQG